MKRFLALAFAGLAACGTAKPGGMSGPTINNKGKRWDATKLGAQLATDVFFTKAPGLRY
mgnify:CR=1 FL=1